MRTEIGQQRIQLGSIGRVDLGEEVGEIIAEPSVHFRARARRIQGNRPHIRFDDLVKGRAGRLGHMEEGDFSHAGSLPSLEGRCKSSEACRILFPS